MCPFSPPPLFVGWPTVVLWELEVGGELEEAEGGVEIRCGQVRSNQIFCSDAVDQCTSIWDEG